MRQREKHKYTQVQNKSPNANFLHDSWKSKVTEINVPALICLWQPIEI